MEATSAAGAGTGRRAGAGTSLMTAPVAAGGLLGGFAVAVASGSRPLGGGVLLASGLLCARTWVARHGWPRALALGGADLALFAASHALARLIGGWPSVVAVSCAMGWLSWRLSDRPFRTRAAA